MAQLLGLTILSALITGLLLVPFIDFLYKIKLQRKKQVTRDVFNKRTPVFDKYNGWKVGTPFGGGVLIILVVSILTLWAYGIFDTQVKGWELFVLLFSFISFGLLGMYDDLKKIIVNRKSGFGIFGLRFRYKFVLQIILALIIAFILNLQLGFDFIYVHGLGLVNMGWFFIPFAAFVIVSFVNAFNIADGLDGLSGGLFLISMLAFLAISYNLLDNFLGIFIAVVIGSVGAFLYFNIFPARIWLGDSGSLALGAVLAVVGLLTGKTIALAVIGGVFIIEVGSSLIQLGSKTLFGKKVLSVSPFHLLLQKRGWEEPKIVMRAWLLGFFFAILGLYIAFIK